MVERAERGPEDVELTGMAAASAFGRGTDPLLAAALEGRAAFGPVRRFDVAGRRTHTAAAMPGSPVLSTELAHAVDEACDAAGLTAAARAACPLFLAVHGDPELGRSKPEDLAEHTCDAFAARIARRCGLSDSVRVYTSACVAAGSAVADASALIARGRASRVVVAAGYLVEPDQFALFDAGRALAADGRVRPFSAGRSGLLLGDGVAAVVLESAAAARRRRVPALARMAGWGRSGDGYHVCRPRPDGSGLARAATAALRRGGIGAERVGYVNAHGSGTRHSDAAETAALYEALGGHAEQVPVSSTKSVHGQALEAGGLLELVVSVGAMRAGRLPVNAGHLGSDEACRLNLILRRPARFAGEYLLSLNVAFGGANTALLVG